MKSSIDSWRLRAGEYSCHHFFSHPQAMCTSVYIFLGAVLTVTTKKQQQTCSCQYPSWPLTSCSHKKFKVWICPVASRKQAFWTRGVTSHKSSCLTLTLSNSAKETFRSQVSNVLHCCIYSTWLKNGFTINMSTVRLTAKLPPSLWDGSGVFNCLLFWPPSLHACGFVAALSFVKHIMYHSSYA